ncbi:MAG TPA: DNA primase small subunit domain-containing protein [Acidobacteriota bacterium]|nr:DNA primase small subunit domain-containing protein [Acidobacteriota bacterium]
MPNWMQKREFAFLLPEKHAMVRHQGFNSQAEFAVFLESIIPSDIYYSCAYYSDPRAHMDKKGWLGADLVFDIDADHIPTKCSKIHDEWTCGSCGFVGKGIVPDKCPACNSEKLDLKSWPCEICLESAKAETIKLFDFLLRDFGFSDGEIHVFFSGHRGYHVHVESKSVQTLGTIGRKEIVDYVLGLGFDVLSEGSVVKHNAKAGIINRPSIHALGWRGRVAKGIQSFFLNTTVDDFRNLGLNKSTIDILAKNKDGILKSWDTEGSWDTVRGVGLASWRRIVEFSKELQRAKVDTVVTTDIHRLIRMSETLHGKTGLRKTEFSKSRIEDFDPFKEAVALQGGIAKIRVSNAPKFRLGDETFGPYENQVVELPTAVAVFLICKDRAVFMEVLE